MRFFVSRYLAFAAHSLIAESVHVVVQTVVLCMLFTSVFPFCKVHQNEMLFLALVWCVPRSKYTNMFCVYYFVLLPLPLLLLLLLLLLLFCKTFLRSGKNCRYKDWAHYQQPHAHTHTQAFTIRVDTWNEYTNEINLMKQLYPESIIFLYLPNINFPFSIAYRLAIADPLYGLIACWWTKLIEIAISSASIW